MDEDKEIKLQYVQEPKPVTEYYIHAEPLPAHARADKERKKPFPKWLIPVIVILTVLGVMGRSVLHRIPLTYFDWDIPSFHFDFTFPKKAETPSMPRYEAHGDFRLRYTTAHDEILFAQQIYRAVNPAVVAIVSSTEKGDYVGTGIILSEDGYILTNEHVLEDAKSCTVILASGDAILASLVGTDAAHDIGVLKINARDLPTAVFGDSDALSVGDKVYAIGNPLGLELRGTMTDGIISAISRNLTVEDGQMSVIQTNAALNNGNSGGPLINSCGQVIGINTLKMGNQRSASATVEGLGFAVPIAEVAYIVNDLIRCGEVQGEGLLGLSVQTLALPLPDQSGSGLLVLSINEGSPADQAGIRSGDYIVQADGAATKTSNDLLCRRRAYCIGEDLPLRIWREGKTLDVSVTLAP